jgi:hypothetical protein
MRSDALSLLTNYTYLLTEGDSMPNTIFPHTLMRRAIAFVAALVPIVALAALPIQASAMKIDITDIQADDTPSWDGCPFRADFSALYNVLDYTGTPHVTFVYHWETVGMESGKHWRSPDKSEAFDLRDLAQMAKIPGLTADEIYDSKQSNHNMYQGPYNKIRLYVSFVMTQPMYVKKTITYDKFCHS